MGIWDMFKRSPPEDKIVYPVGYHREGKDMIIVERDYLNRWVTQFGNDKVAVTKLLAHLKEQYPEVTNFQIRK